MVIPTIPFQMRLKFRRNQQQLIGVMTLFESPSLAASHFPSSPSFYLLLFSISFSLFPLPSPPLSPLPPLSLSLFSHNSYFFPYLFSFLILPTFSISSSKRSASNNTISTDEQSPFIALKQPSFVEIYKLEISKVSEGLTGDDVLAVIVRKHRTSSSDYTFRRTDIIRIYYT